VIDVEAALLHDLFDVAIAQWVRQVPTDTLEYHLLLKVASFEADHEFTEKVWVGALRVSNELGRCVFAAEPKKLMGTETSTS